MNVYELIYLYFLKDEEAYEQLYRYYYPLIVSTMSRQMADMYHMKEEMLEISHQVLFECLEKCRIDRYWQFTSFFKRCLQNRWMDFYKFEKRHDISLRYDSFSLDSAIKEDSNLYPYDIISDGKHLHNQVMRKLEKERLDQMAQKEFTYLELHILSLRRMGMRPVDIAQTLQMDVTKVRTILSKLKKWYTLH